MNQRVLTSFVAIAVVSCGPQAEPTEDLGRLQQAVGPFTYGVDRAGVLSVSEAQSYKSQYGISWTGAYIGGACNGGSGWTESAITAICNATGWKIMPIYVGQQSAAICGAHNMTAGQGTADGQNAAAIMAQYHWAAHGGIPVALDFEAGSFASDPSAATAYVHAWVNAVHAAGYVAYVYSSPSGIRSFAQSGLPIDGVWIASYWHTSFQPGLSPYAEPDFSGYFNSHDRAWQYAGAGYIDFSTADLTLAPAPGQSNGPAPTLDSASSNGGISLVNWTDGHTEAFFTSTGSDLMHVWTNGTADTWNAAASLDTGVACGSSSIYWPAPWLYAEIFSPRTNGSTGHLWWANNVWNKFQAFGGTNLSQFQTLTWQDGHTEVFALGADHAIWHQYWNLTTSSWSGWQSLGGTLAHGPSVIVWGDGHGEMFATAPDHQIYHMWTGASGWSAWTAMGGSISSRPTTVRLKSGDVNVYAIGTDGHLYEATSTGGWSAFKPLETTTELFGDPSAIVNTSGSIEVFARDSAGHVLHTWSGSSWAPLQELGTSPVAASDPFGWVRKDGSVDVFVVDTQGQLMHINRSTGNVWGAWQSIASGAAPCGQALPAPDAGTLDAGRAEDGGTVTDSGTGTQTDGGSGQPGDDAGATGNPDGGQGGTGPRGCSSAGQELIFPALAIALALAFKKRRY